MMIEDEMIEMYFGGSDPRRPAGLPARRVRQEGADSAKGGWGGMSDRRKQKKLRKKENAGKFVSHDAILAAFGNQVN
jgi:hypothetical protein